MLGAPSDKAAHPCPRNQNRLDAATAAPDSSRHCTVIGASAIHVRCMAELTEDDVREIEQIHSNWIEYEVVGDDHRLMVLCADDIELWPPNAEPVVGREAALAQMAHGTASIHRIEIFGRRIRGSNEIAYLTANFKTTFSSEGDRTPKQALGNHLWILRKRADTWLVHLVSWSSLDQRI